MKEATLHSGARVGNDPISIFGLYDRDSLSSNVDFAFVIFLKKGLMVQHAEFSGFNLDVK